MIRNVSALGLVFIVAAMAACGGKSVPAVPAPAARASTPPPPERPTSASNDAAARQREADAARQREAERARARETLAEMVFFDYDRSEIRADSRAVLDRKARILRDQPDIRLRVEGHADERGSTEYNLALGSRRAAAVKAYLAGVGINGSRVETTTYGESRPLAVGSNEAAWARNRRAEFVVTAGAVASGR